LGDESRFYILHTHEASDNFKLRDPQDYADALNAEYLLAGWTFFDRASLLISFVLGCVQL